MTEQEAIRELEINIDLPFGSTVSNEASELAIKALEKQIAKKPILQKDAIGLMHEKCPSCGSFRIGYYCMKCGQKLDWGNEDAE